VDLNPKHIFELIFQLISHHKNLIEEEKNLLNVELKSLDTAIETQRQQTEQL